MANSPIPEKQTEPASISRQDSYLPRQPKMKIQPRLDLFLERFTIHGNFTRAAREAEIGVSTAYRYTKNDPEFRKRFLEADEIAGLALRDEVLRRAMEGVAKPVFYKGQQCGEIHEYSNRLLLTLLRARYPEFRTKQEPGAPADTSVNLPNVTIKVIDSVKDAGDDRV